MFLDFFNYFTTHAKRLSVDRNNSQPFTIYGFTYSSSTKLVGKYRLYLYLSIYLYIYIYISIYLYWKKMKITIFDLWFLPEPFIIVTWIFFWGVMLISRCSKKNSSVCGIGNMVFQRPENGDFGHFIRFVYFYSWQVEFCENWDILKCHFYDVFVLCRMLLVGCTSN